MSYTGTYDKTVFYNPVNKYCIICIKTDDKNIPPHARSTYRRADHLIRFTAVGYDLPRTDAVKLELDGEWKTDEKHGCQLQVEQWKEIIPHTKNGVQGYLSSGLLKGIGEKTAAAIIDRFGVEALNILENQPERLLEIKGITEERLKDIKTSYSESRMLRDIMTLLSPFQLTPKAALKIYEYFGPASLDVLKKSPYALCQIPGFGFKRIDAIVRKTDCPLNDPMRISGAIFYALDDSKNKEGHLYLEHEVLVKSAFTLLNEKIPLPQMRVRRQEVKDELQTMILNGDVVSNRENIYLPKTFELEDETARRISQILLEVPPKDRIAHPLEEIKEQLGISLSKKQEEAVEMVFQHNLSIITGSPGTGKTTVLKTVLKVYQKLYETGKIVLAAPTGRASRRMAESTGFSQAQTLHSALGLLGEDAENKFWKRTEALDADLVIVDEFSMTDMWLAKQLFSRIKPGTKILLVGDADQLPSVGAGNVFRELIGCGLIPVTVLDEIFRQAKDSLIAHNAKFINEAKTSLYYGNDFVFVKCKTQPEAAAAIQRIYFDEIAKSSIEQVQILSPFRSDGEASAEKLNEVIRERVNPAAEGVDELKVGLRIFRVNDRVMQTKNKGEISNGDVGFIRKIQKDSSGADRILIEFTDDRSVEYGAEDMGTIELAYAMTVHKAMGSEYDTVIIPILSAHTILLYRNLVYTAITRAKRRVFLVGQKDVLFMAIHRTKIDKRNTLLGQRITLYYKALSKKRGNGQVA
ncbi:SF1B family DNA helicase RecD2 [Caproicibacter sp. BJN0012]|uniref:SF1B family DNA helicase RecD2 n=1 Tax=Caproicibacter sp. BJN0012 TaxID=3110227 RepID=UPI002E10BF27|nr:ATP-dependent RecD-like DNA helicase [Caproicibacter sp. BJN0012]